MREELIVRLRGTWQQTEPPDPGLVGTALARFGADLVEVMPVEPGDLRMLIVVPETADLIAVGRRVSTRSSRIPRTGRTRLLMGDT
ncbi:hypothetical protein ACWEWX_50905, partial [Streptomyces asiaticus]